jgi:hypothetical protein
MHPVIGRIAFIVCWALIAGLSGMATHKIFVDNGPLYLVVFCGIACLVAVSVVGAAVVEFFGDR